MSDVQELVYTSRDNAIELSLSTDGVPISHKGITRCQLQVKTTLIDSDVNPEFFDLTQDDRLILTLGRAGLAKGVYTASLYVFDVNSTNGLFWGDFSLTVVA